MRKGELKFVLTGRRLNGRFTLVRLHRRDPGKQEAWFLIKGHDEEARKGVSAPVLEHEPLASRRHGNSSKQTIGRRHRALFGARRPLTKHRNSAS